jgi:translation initiation factor 5B
LVIDTPGHETFSNLRKRGGSAADIAILVIDLIKGVEPQTVESIEILKARKTPFLVAANKLDLIPNWKSNPNSSFLDSFNLQPDEVKGMLEEKIYGLVGDLSNRGFQSERYDRVKDFRTHVAIVPTSAKTGEGTADLMTVLVGLTQAFLKKDLMVTSGPAKGVVLEVKEELGLGVTINAIIYDGEIEINDRIVMGGREETIETSVRAILIPKPLDEIRDPKDRFMSVRKVSAAAGIKIASPNLDLALAGSPLYVVPKDADSNRFKERIKEEVGKLRITTDRAGVVIKADTLGSLEALISMLQPQGVHIRLADVGDVSKRDSVEAESVKKKEPTLGAILAFNVEVLPDAQKEIEKWGIPIFKTNIIYHLVEQYQEWARKLRLSQISAEFASLIKPGKLRVLRDFIFRRSKPAIVGVEVLKGRIESGYPLINAQGKRVGKVLRIQDKGKDVPEAIKSTQVAVSIDEGFVGRNIFEDDLLYVDVPQNHREIILAKFENELSEEEVEVLGELEKIMEELHNNAFE